MLTTILGMLRNTVNKASFTLKIKKIMGKLDDMTALITNINDSTNNIAADLERIAGGITGGLTKEEADGVIAELQVAADKLKTVSDVHLEEEPPV